MNKHIFSCFLLLFFQKTIANEVGACADIVSATARLSCYDNSLSQKSPESPVEQRKRLEVEANSNWFSIVPHRPNYILPFTYNRSADYSVYGIFEDDLSDNEVKFQISLKIPLVDQLWLNSSVFVAYTQQSYWQLYADEDASAPFRETNHEPEITWSFPFSGKAMGFNLKQVAFSLNHQSNGRSEPLSRSWNRTVAQVVAERGNLVLSMTAWKRLDEDANDDNNPEVSEYMGRFELGGAYKTNDHTIGLGIKNNARSLSRSGIQLDWTFPFSSHLKGYVQVYSGYGENLIDQEIYHNRIGIGLALTDWL